MTKEFFVVTKLLHLCITNVSLQLIRELTDLEYQNYKEFRSYVHKRLQKTADYRTRQYLTKF